MKTHLRNLLLRDFAVCIVLAIIFTVLGVYDTDTLPPLYKFGFWIILMFAGAIATALAEPLVFHKLMQGHRPILQVFAIASLISIPISIGLVGVNTSFAFEWSLLNWILQYVSVWFIAVLVVTGRFVTPHVLALISADTQTQASPLSKTYSNPVEKFLKRLPLRFHTAQLYAVSSEGHYLRVHTDKGEDLILMRLSDAIRELQNADGLQVQRSWWVARQGIEETRSQSGKRTLLLKSGVKAPVSRSFLQALKDAGLDK